MFNHKLPVYIQYSFYLREARKLLCNNLSVSKKSNNNFKTDIIYRPSFASRIEMHLLRIELIMLLTAACAMFVHCS